jgi:aspartate dehydrogenase
MAHLHANTRDLRAGLIGFGAIAEAFITSLRARGELQRLVGVLVRPERIEALRATADRGLVFVDTIEALLGLQPDVVVEAAGHVAVARYGMKVLAARRHLLIASVGALAERELAQQMAREVSPAAGVWIASGAVAGLDGLLAARTCGLHSVTFTSRKSPPAWSGTRAESLLDAASSEPLMFFEGTAREAASQYPRNANVAAAVALAGLGLERTKVRLISDPGIAGPVGLIEAEGAFGRFRFEMLGLASASNPRTSAIAGHSLGAALLEGMCFSLRPD